jgi:hypothetical protein
LHQRARLLGGNLLDIDAAGGRKHDGRASRRSVGHDGQIELAADLGARLDQHLFHRVAGDRHGQDGFGRFGSIRRAVGDPDPARLAALAGRHLGLDHARADRGERIAGFGRAGAQAPFGHRHAGRHQHKGLGGMLGEVHRP